MDRLNWRYGVVANVTGFHIQADRGNRAQSLRKDRSGARLHRLVGKRAAAANLETAFVAADPLSRVGRRLALVGTNFEDLRETKEFVKKWRT